MVRGGIAALRLPDGENDHMRLQMGALRLTCRIKGHPGSFGPLLKCGWAAEFSIIVPGALKWKESSRREIGQGVK